MTVLVKILQFAIANDEKVAVFSQSLATLDVIEVNEHNAFLVVDLLIIPTITVTAQSIERTPELDRVL